MGILKGTKLNTRLPIPIGLKYNMLTAIGEGNEIYDKDGRPMRTVICRCDCGSEIVKRLSHFKSGKLVSCGCAKTILGEHRNTPTWQTWIGMTRRCTEVTHTKYKDYGGRGITVCDRWMERPNGFLNFVEDMGERPEGRTLDRINVDGNYEPSNCRWATWEEQANNRRNNIVRNPE